MKKYFTIIILLALIANFSYSQFGDLLKRRAAEGAKQGAEAGAERTIDKGIDKLFSRKNKKSKAPVDNSVNETDKEATGQKQTLPSLKTYSKYDFIAGEKIIVFDNFSQVAVGDFPDKWTTNASGEVMIVDQHEGKWLNISKQGFFIPQAIKSLPANFTIEYDILFIPPAKYGGPNTAVVGFQIFNATTAKALFDNGADRSYFELDPYMGNVNIAGYTKTGEKILSNEFQVSGIQRQHTFTYHVAVWRQQNRLRVYLNETKVIDAPSLLSPDIKYNSLRFNTSMNNDGSIWLVSAFKMATGLPDTRNKLLNEGRFSTTGILFDVNSAAAKASSYGALKDIAAVLKDNPELKVKIVGHTDSDGDNAANLELSRKRAATVKTILRDEFAIEESRLQSDGEGEANPAVPNTSEENKAQNRRVEFIKL